jgi:hypothetical protein
MRPSVDERLQGAERLLADAAADPALSAATADLLANAMRLVQQVSSTWSAMLGFYVADNAKMHGLLGSEAEDPGLDVARAEQVNERLRAELAQVITGLPRDADGRSARAKILTYLRERTDISPA